METHSMALSTCQLVSSTAAPAAHKRAPLTVPPHRAPGHLPQRRGSLLTPLPLLAHIIRHPAHGEGDLTRLLAPILATQQLAPPPTSSGQEAASIPPLADGCQAFPARPESNPAGRGVDGGVFNTGDEIPREETGVKKCAESLGVESGCAASRACFQFPRHCVLTHRVQSHSSTSVEVGLPGSLGERAHEEGRFRTARILL